MPKPRRLLRGEITYSAAKEKETNVLHTLGYWDQKVKFFNHLDNNRALIQTVIAHHLGLASATTCHIEEQEKWLHGSFNVLIPAVVEDKRKGRSNRRVMVRFPLPYRVGEAFRPGNADEKLRCEAGAYAWLQENCPTIPIPRLYGFGLSTGQSFTRLDHLPLLSRGYQYIRRRLLAWLGYPVPSLYIPHRQPSQALNCLGMGYLLIECVENGREMMLSNTWEDGRNNALLRKNLFRDLSRILLSLARIPLPRIGSFIIKDDGFLDLANRPLSLEIQDLENERIPVDIPRDCTYSNVDSYVTDTLAFHDSRLTHQPNGANDRGDCIYQMSALSMIRTVSSLFMRRDLRNGPFIFTLTDLHQSNILVDDNWHIKYIVDLEWSCSRPIEFTLPPRWLTNQAIDEMDAEAYGKIREEFMTVLQKEEEKDGEDSGVEGSISPRLSSVMNRGWEIGTFWYALALKSPTGLFRVFYDHIQPRLAKGHEEDGQFFRIVLYYWTLNAIEFIQTKLEDKEEYDKQLRAAFED